MDAPDLQLNPSQSGRTRVASDTSDNKTPSDADHGDQRSPPAKRRKEEKERSRVSRACDRCKRKKTRCTGRCPCSLCLRSGLPCEFTASYTRGRLPSVIVDEDAMAANHPKIAISGATSTSTGSPAAASFGRNLHGAEVSHSTIGGALHNPDAEKLNITAEEAPRDSASRSSPELTQMDQQGHYIGPSSAASFLIRIQKTLHQNSSVSNESSIFAFGDAPLPEFDPTFFVLPPKADAQRLVERYFDFAAPTHRFLHRPVVEEMLEEFYDTQGDMRNKDEAASKTALLLIIFAQGQAYMPPGSMTPNTSSRYYFAAEHQLAKERGAVRLASVQARLGQCFYLMTQSRINHCWSLFGTTAHLALAIGLNRARRIDPNCGKVDYVEHEMRKRVFWAAYVLDKYLACALGRPRTFKDEDIDQEIPTIVNDDDLHTHSIDPPTSRAVSLMVAPVQHIKLSRIISCVLRDLYPIRPPSMSLRYELAAKYTNDLKEWRAGIARFLDVEGLDLSLLIPLYQRQRNVLNLGYYHAVLLIQRPFLLGNFARLAHVDGRLGNASSLDTSQNIAECLDAAMSIVRIVDELFQGSQIYGAFWFTQYYAFCSVVVLYIYRIQQHLVEPDKCEGYFSAGQKCQSQLSALSDTDCLSKRYCLVLEELRLEAIRQTSQPTQPPQQHSKPPLPAPNTSSTTIDPATSTSLSEPTLNDISSSLAIPNSMSSKNDFSAPFYGGNIPPTPESAIFNSNFISTDALMNDMTSWGQFDSLVTAGIGVLDTGFQNDLANFAGWNFR